MTQEDLDQIGAIVTSTVSAAISANNEVLLARVRTMQDHFDVRIAGLGNDVSRRLNRIEQRLDLLEGRFDAFEFQMARIIGQSPRLRIAMAN